MMAGTLAATSPARPSMAHAARPMPAWARDMQRMMAGGADRCRAKVAYSSEQQARAHGSGFLKKTEQDIRRLWPYACPHCRRWHLTKRPNSDAAITASARHEGVPI